MLMLMCFFGSLLRPEGAFKLILQHTFTVSNAYTRRKHNPTKEHATRQATKSLLAALKPYRFTSLSIETIQTKPRKGRFAGATGSLDEKR